MPIVVKCGCGERFEVLEEYAGLKVRCDGCWALVVVPEARDNVEAGDGYAVEQHRKCPGCRKELPADAVLCVRCGWDFRKGKRRQTTYDEVTRRWTSAPSLLGVTLHLTFVRDRRGRSTLTLRRRWFGTLPLGTRVLDLDDYRTVLVDCALGDDTGDTPVSDVYYLYLENRDGRQVRVFQDFDEFRMREVVDSLQELAKLTVKRR
jgi:predicted nucleic acid-binding Zn ribbon protein